MKLTWLSQWTRWQFLTTQLTLISVLFLYGVVGLDTSLVAALFVVVVLSTVLAQWIGSTLYPMIDRSRLQGDFLVMRRTMVVHLLHLLVGTALVAASAIAVMQWVESTSDVTLGLVVIVVVALNKVLSATLRAQATLIVLQAHALRRTVLLVGLIGGLLFRQQPWLDVVLFAVLIAAPLSSSVRLVVGHAQMYKEFRYRRQFEDSGNQTSLLSLFVSLTKRYASTFGQIALPLGLGFLLVGLMQLVGVTLATDALRRSLVVALGIIALGRLLVVTCLPDTSQWMQYVAVKNHSVLREQLGATSEQLLYRSLIAGLVWFGTGFVLGPSVYQTLAMLLGSTAVVMVSGFYLFDQRVLGLLRVSQQWVIVVGALLVFSLNSGLLLIYYPSVALMIGFVMSVGWIHAASLLLWTRSFDFELKIHLVQSAKMVGIVGSSLLVNAGIAWLLAQVPLGVGPLVEPLIFLGLFAIITSVVVYSLTYALGVHSSLKSRSEILEQLSTQFMEYEEEEAIW